MTGGQGSPSDERAWAAIIRLRQGLDYALGRIIDMTAQQTDFDQAFSNLSSAVGTLITDFQQLNTKIQNLPPSGPSPAQVQEIQTLSAQVQAALPASSPVAPTVPSPSPVETVARTEYTFDGDPTTVDAATWPLAPDKTPEGKPLYYYAGDTAPGDARGDGQGGGIWHIYHAPVTPPTPAAASAPTL